MAKEESKKKSNTVNKKTVSKKVTGNKVSKSTSSKVVTSKKAPVKAEEVKETPKVPAIVQEENHFGRTILAAALILVMFLAGYLGIKYKMDSGTSKERYNATEDEKRFKEAYESLNGTTRSNGQKNKNIEVKSDNNIVYISTKEAADILDSGSGVIYFGFSSCPWCRNLVPVLVDAINSTGLDKVYYVDVRPDDNPQNDIRDRYELSNRGKPVIAKEADQYYSKILLPLAGILDDYVLTGESGKKVNIGEKRLLAPTIVTVKDGELMKYHIGTVDNHEKDDNGDLRDLTKEEENQLFNTLTEMFSDYLGNGCQEDGC